MSNTKVFRNSTSSEVALPPAVAIHDGEVPARGRASGSGNYGESIGGNPSLNGRAPWPLPKGLLEVLWMRDLESPYAVASLMAAGGSVYVAGKARWVVMDAKTGQSRAGGLRGLGAGALDGENKLFFQPDPDGQLQGLYLEHGQPVFWSPLLLNANVVRPFSARIGDSQVLVGHARRQPGAENPNERRWTTVEALPVGPRPEIRESRQLQPGTIAPLLFENPDALAAAWGSGLALAFTGELFLIDDNLQVTQRLTGELQPIAMSVDEGGHAHLLVDEPGGKRALWIVSPEGVRSLRMVLPAPFENAQQPPFINSARDVIIRGPSGILCITQAGAIRWSRPIAAPGGAVLTADGKLLATDGPDLIAFDEEGQRTLVHHFEGEKLTTAPVLEEGGIITVASAGKVFHLRPNPRSRN